MKKRINYFVVILVMLLLVGCKEQVKDPSIKANNNSTNNDTYNQNALKEAKVMESAMGGNDYWYREPYIDIFSGIPDEIGNLVDIADSVAWFNQFENAANHEGRDINEFNLYYFVKDLNISKEDFMNAISDNWEYTQEQKDALFTNDLRLVNEALVNPYALCVDGKIYTIDWLSSHTAEDYKKQGISEEILLPYLETLEIAEVRDNARTINGIMEKDKKVNEKNDKEDKINNKDEKVGSKVVLLAPYQYEYYSLDSFIYEIVEEQVLVDWLKYFNYMECYALGTDNFRQISECTMINLVKELDIPKEDFIKANNGEVYTEKQIDAIYSGSQYEVNINFVNDYTVLLNGNIYTAEWLATNTIKEYEAVGITEQMVQDFVDKTNIPELEQTEEILSIKDALEEMRKN